MANITVGGKIHLKNDNGDAECGTITRFARDLRQVEADADCAKCIKIQRAADDYADRMAYYAGLRDQQDETLSQAEMVEPQQSRRIKAVRDINTANTRGYEMFVPAGSFGTIECEQDGEFLVKWDGRPANTWIASSDFAYQPDVLAAQPQDAAEVATVAELEAAERSLIERLEVVRRNLAERRAASTEWPTGPVKAVIRPGSRGRILDLSWGPYSATGTVNDSGCWEVRDARHDLMTDRFMSRRNAARAWVRHLGYPGEMPDIETV